ncbi:MAG: addiction module toxin, HicA family [Pseudomonadota bacterium]
MKRAFLVQHLIRSGCELTGEASTHSTWTNLENDASADVARQPEIERVDVAKICLALGIAQPADTTPIH